jgi:hypothetical protein
MAKRDVAEQGIVELHAGVACGSASCAAFISFITHGWQRIAPWPKIIRLRVMMLAPSTVIAIGAACQERGRRSCVAPG